MRKTGTSSGFILAMGCHLAHNTIRKGTVLMDVVYQLVFVLHIYQLMKLCRTYFDLDHIEEEKQDKRERKTVFPVVRCAGYGIFCVCL